MSKRPALKVHVTGQARRDFATVLRRSLQEFGETASIRYKALIMQALSDIGDDPKRPSSQERPDIMIKGARTYRLSFSRGRVSGPRVKEPCHFLLYRRLEDGVIEVARIFHDSRDLQLHMPEEYRQQNPDG